MSPGQGVSAILAVGKDGPLSNTCTPLGTARDEGAPAPAQTSTALFIYFSFSWTQ